MCIYIIHLLLFYSVYSLSEMAQHGFNRVSSGFSFDKFSYYIQGQSEMSELELISSDCILKN